jgi:hypothetical protein
MKGFLLQFDKLLLGLVYAFYHFHRQTAYANRSNQYQTYIHTNNKKIFQLPIDNYFEVSGFFVEAICFNKFHLDPPGICCSIEFRITKAGWIVNQFLVARFTCSNPCLN